MGEVIRMLPRGRYPAWEAGHLAGVSGHTVGQWARRGYIRSSAREASPRLYSFQDVAEALVVHELLERHVRHADIQRAIPSLRDRYGDWALTDAPLATLRGDGRDRLVVLDEQDAYEASSDGWQQVVGVEHLEDVRRQLRHGGWAVRRLRDLEHIEVDPDRLGGRPTIRGRRIAAQDVAEMADAADGLEVLEVDYELRPEQIRDAQRWWREVRRLESAAAVG